MFNNLFTSTKSRLTAIVRESLEENSYTPDRILLDQTEKVLVFEYGDLQRGFTHHRMIGGDFITHAVTHDYYYVWYAKQEKFVMVSKIGGINAGRSRVRGELFRVSPTHLTNVDRHRENGVKFLRKNIRILLPSGEVMTVFAYVAIDAYWKETVQWDNQFHRGNGGSSYIPLNADQEDLKRPFLGRYTEFTPETLQEKKTCCMPYPTYQAPQARANAESTIEFLSFNHDTGKWE